MIKGIDISNWQSDMRIDFLSGIDFCICKATESTWYVDPTCDRFIQACKKEGLLWGFYHFNGHDSAENEAAFFYENCKGYIGQGIPVLDYESNNANDREWIEGFCSKFHSLSGIYPVVYMSEFAPVGLNTLIGSWVPEKCGLWCANYNKDYPSWPTIDDCPINPYPWPFVAIWQFASDFHIPGYAGNLDADIAFMDKAAWMKYAGSGTDTATDSKKKISITVDGKKYSGWVRER